MTLPILPEDRQIELDVDFSILAERYCKGTDLKPEELRQKLLDAKTKFSPDGFVLLECHDMSSSRLGELSIYPYGPNNTFKGPPAVPVSPRGLASDQAVVVAILKADRL